MEDVSHITIPPEILDRLRSARKVVALTGAGISAESGINTFHDNWSLAFAHRDKGFLMAIERQLSGN